MKKLFFICFSFIIFSVSFGQDSWKVIVNKIDPSNYYGEMVNGIIGIVSSPKHLQCKTVVLNGAYDQYGRGT